TGQRGPAGRHAAREGIPPAHPDEALRPARGARRRGHFPVIRSGKLRQRRDDRGGRRLPREWSQPMSSIMTQNEASEEAIATLLDKIEEMAFQDPTAALAELEAAPPELAADPAVS